MYPDHSVSNHSAYYSFSLGPSTFASSHGNNNLGQSSASSSSAMPSSLLSLKHIEDPSWYIDNGATNHITNDLGKLLHSQVYIGTEKLFVEDGNALAIAHVGSGLLDTSTSKPLLLNHVRHVPYITKNLLNISKLLADNPITIEFLSNLCFVKVKNTRIILLEGVPKRGLYRVSPHAAAQSVFLSSVGPNKLQSFFAWCSVFNSDKSTIVNLYELNKKSCLSVVTKNSIYVNLRNRILGHPASYTLKICNNSAAYNKIESLKFCIACQFSKNHKLHFDSVETKTSAPL